jgi:Protein of unknown function (DUF1553)/Protein of unknown function (DUF1549)
MPHTRRSTRRSGRPIAAASALALACVLAVDAAAHAGSAKPDQPRPLTTSKRAGYDWWSLQPLKTTDPPAVHHADWAINDIDRFVLARLEAHGLAPAPPANKRTLIRRLYFDLVGLPPTPQEVEDFIKDASPQAYDKLVDRLLASPHYGERWARHWLDVIRFGESQGFERNTFLDKSWRFRDWVIDAFNEDLPYDQFVRDQIAGDVLRPNNPKAIIATGYLTGGPWDHVGENEGTAAMKKAYRQDELEDLTASLGQAFMGLTLQCARCHDHKFDPILSREYYSVSATLGGLRRGERDTLTGKGREAVRPMHEKLGGQIAALTEKLRAIDSDVGKKLIDEERAARVERAEQRVKDAQKKLDNAKDKQKERDKAAKELNEAKRAVDEARKSEPDVSFGRIIDALPAERRDAYRELVLQASDLELRDGLISGGPTYAITPRQPDVFHVLARGDYRQPGDVVSPAAVDALAGFDGDLHLKPDAPEADRRAAIAKWITDPHNPLTPRVIVNRLWHYHFGAGIIKTPSDFGFQGGQPSHPLLLDWLANDLMAHGWSLKHVQRLIVTSATYRQASNVSNATAEAADGDNRLLWRQNPARLEAEMVRDSVLAVAGELNPQMGGPSYHDFKLDVQGDNTGYPPADVWGSEVNRRTVYRAWVRASYNPMLDTLDCPEPSVATPARSVTTTPVQALSLLNNAFMRRAADAFASRLKREAGDKAAAQVALAYRLAFSRSPDDGERDRAKQFVAKFGLSEFCLVLMNANEFLYVD